MRPLIVSLLAFAALGFANSDASAFGAKAEGRAADGTPVVSLITRPDATRASADAMRVCERMLARRSGAPRERCRVTRTFQNECSAVASDNRQRLFAGYANSNENYWSRVRALDACRRAGGGTSCSIVRSVCDRTPGRARSGTDLPS